MKMMANDDRLRESLPRKRKIDLKTLEGLILNSRIIFPKSWNFSYHKVSPDQYRLAQIMTVYYRRLIIGILFTYHGITFPIT